MERVNGSFQRKSFLNNAAIIIMAIRGVLLLESCSAFLSSDTSSNKVNNTANKYESTCSDNSNSSNITNNMIENKCDTM